MRETRARIGNALAFQAAWLGCVVGAARGMPLLGPALTAIVGATFVAGTKPRAKAALLLLLAGLAGLLVDGGLVAFGAMSFATAAGGPAIAAPWMVALWVAFATTLPWSLSFLRGRPWLAAFAGALAGPLAYWAGARLGAIHLGEPLAVALGAVSITWALALPALVLASEKLLPGGGARVDGVG